MKELLILRHADAESEHGGGDFQRPLSSRGRQQAASLATNLQARQWFPEIILSSSAERTMQTSRILAANMPSTRIIYDRALYMAFPHELLQALSTLPTEKQRVAIVAHNPGISYLAALLTGNSDLPELPTAGSHMLQLDIETWQEIHPACGSLM